MTSKSIQDRGEPLENDITKNVEELTRELAEDKNVLAIARLESRAQLGADSQNRVFLLLLVNDLPLDLDMYGKKQLDRSGVRFTLVFTRPDRARTAIDDEAGCWIISGYVLYSKSLYDPGGILFKLRKVVNSVPKKRRIEVFNKWLNEARTYPSIMLKREPSREPSINNTFLGENVALARTLFSLNGKPPRGEAVLVDDLMNLQMLPPGFDSIMETIKCLDRRDARKFRIAKKDYDSVIAGIEVLAKGI